MREHDDVEAALAAALRPGRVDDAAARAALAAFRAARDTGLHRPGAPGVARTGVPYRNAARDAR
ncbi:hypothetical protein ACF07V_08465 [Streptomyces sp. NPDC015661]|uniref:hypothetical protein n=1 Tax=Streptomyces sp. NPDC015661 TaxID=3364961 RepID=UPI0036F6B5A7